MFSFKSRKKEENDKNRAVVRQDSRTNVKTAMAQSETTNTTTQNCTIYNNKEKTVTYQSTRQTVTTKQIAGVTEKTSIRTPTVEEVEEMIHFYNKPDKKTFSTTTTTTSSNLPLLGNTPWKLTSSSYTRKLENAISPKNVKSNTFPTSFIFDTSDTSKTPKSPTLVKISTTTVTENNGSKITQRSEEHPIKFDFKNFKLSTPNSPLTKNFSTYKSDAWPISSTSSNGIYSTSNKATFANPLISKSISTPSATKTFSTTTKSPTTFTKTTYTAPILSATSKPTSTFSSNAPKITALTTTTCTPTTSSTKTMASTPKAIGKSVTPPLYKPGVAYIFNNVVFDDPNNKERIGSDEDVKALVDTFNFFQMKVTVIDNAKLYKIRKTVEKIKSKDFKQNACLVIVILSHGSRNEKISATDGQYCINDEVLFPILQNPTLNEKPKLFFIQACKGSITPNGYYTDATPFNQDINANEILKCYSTFEGFVSYRTEKGSLFIQALCKNLKLFGSIKNIKDIMELVIRIVKTESRNSQIPSYTTTLTKRFVFGDYVKRS